jgi:hypothetical protein
MQPHSREHRPLLLPRVRELNREYCPEGARKGSIRGSTVSPVEHDAIAGPENGVAFVREHGGEREIERLVGAGDVAVGVEQDIGRADAFGELGEGGAVGEMRSEARLRADRCIGRDARDGGRDRALVRLIVPEARVIEPTGGRKRARGPEGNRRTDDEQGEGNPTPPVRFPRREGGAVGAHCMRPLALAEC